MPPSSTRLLLILVLIAVSACTEEGAPDGEPTTTAPPPLTMATTTSSTTTSTTTTTTSTTTTTTIPTFDLTGTVVTPNGEPLRGATVATGAIETTTGDDGSFLIADVPVGVVTASRPAWMPATLDWDGAEDPVEIVLEPRTVRALRVSRYVASDPAMYDTTLDLARGSMVNALVFDTKDETGQVLYETSVQEAHDIGAVEVVYDPTEYLAAADEAGLYTITRIVAFEDRIRARQRPEAKLAGWWVDPADPANWEYPLALAVEACDLGFDEIQFDYVRFPTGRTADASRASQPATQEGRLDVIASFLAEARDRLHPLGCALSADIFGIVMSAENDQGIGQRPEEISTVVDAVSPMIYPSHYSNGWLGLPDPNDYPGEVTADALDSGSPRLASTTLLRPWLQAFWWSSSQIAEAIAVTEERGFGWMLWNAAGSYPEAALPDLPTSPDADGDDAGAPEAASDDE